MKTFSTTTTATPEIAPPAEDTRRHLFTTAAGVILPMLQAIMTGVFVTILVGFYAYLLESPVWWKWGAVVGGAAVLVVWFVLIWRWLRLTAPLETVTGIDINQDGHIGPPPVVRVELTSQDKRSTQIAELPYPERLPTMARGLVSGQPLAERQWAGHGKLFSQNEFYKIRDELMRRGWARYVNPWAPKQGIELSPAGRAVMAKLATPHPAAPALVVQGEDN